MPYQTGQFTSLADLEATIKTFAQANGWTLAGNVLHNGSGYFSLTTSGDALRVRGGLGIDGSNNLTTQGGEMMIYGGLDGGISYPATYHLFAHAGPDNIFCVVNYNVLYHQHLAFGEIRQAGVYSGGQYFSASCGDDYDGRGVFGDSLSAVFTRSPNWPYPALNPGAYLIQSTGESNIGMANANLYCDLDGATWRTNYLGNQYQALPSTWFEGSGQAEYFIRPLDPSSAQPVLGPVVITAGRPSGLSSIIGDMPHARYVRIDNYESGDIIQVGTQNWMAFPHTYKSHSVAGWCIKYDGP